MFTIEHEFDASIVTLIDEGPPPLQEDVIIRAFGEGVVLEQLDDDGKTVHHIRLSMRQLAELRAALDLPEGNYRLTPRV